MYLSDYSEQNFLRCFSGTPFVAPGTVYATLSSADPGDNGATLLEPNYAGYTRMPVTFTVPAPIADVENSLGIQNEVEVKFARAESDQATATHIAFLDSMSAGNMLFYAKLDTAKTIRANIEPVIRAGEARFWFASAHTTDELKRRMLNVFRGTTLPEITPFASLANGDTELFGGNFARVPVNFSLPTHLATGPYEIANAEAVVFAVASIALGNYDTDCLYDAATGGSLLIAYPGITDFYAAGDRTAYDPGAWQFAVN